MLYFRGYIYTVLQTIHKLHRGIKNLFLLLQVYRTVQIFLNHSNATNTLDTLLYFRARSYSIRSRGVYCLQSTLVSSCAVIWNCCCTCSRDVFLRGTIVASFTRSWTGYSATATFTMYARVWKWMRTGNQLPWRVMSFCMFVLLDSLLRECWSAISRLIIFISIDWLSFIFLAWAWEILMPGSLKLWYFSTRREGHTCSHVGLKCARRRNLDVSSSVLK